MDLIHKNLWLTNKCHIQQTKPARLLPIITLNVMRSNCGLIWVWILFITFSITLVMVVVLFTSYDAYQPYVCCENHPLSIQERYRGHQSFLIKTLHTCMTHTCTVRVRVPWCINVTKTFCSNTFTNQDTTTDVVLGSSNTWWITLQYLIVLQRFPAHVHCCDVCFIYLFLPHLFIHVHTTTNKSWC